MGYMRRAKSPSERGFDRYDKRRLTRALQETAEVRIYRRVQAVLLVAQGRTVAEAAQITGQNDKRVLFGTINPRTGHRVVLCRPRQRQEDFQAFPRELRRPKLFAKPASYRRTSGSKLSCENFWLLT